METKVDKPLHTCMTKATTAEGDQMMHGPNWVVAKRGRLKVFADRLECGEWIIRNEEITEATLYSVRSLFFIPGYVLKIMTEEKSYHFGLNWGSFWRGDLPFAVAREKGTIGYTKFSIIIRVVLLGLALYYLWQTLGE